MPVGEVDTVLDRGGVPAVLRIAAAGESAKEAERRERARDAHRVVGQDGILHQVVLPEEGQGAPRVMADTGETQVIVELALRIRVAERGLVGKRGANRVEDRMDAVEERQ